MRRGDPFEYPHAAEADRYFVYTSRDRRSWRVGKGGWRAGVEAAANQRSNPVLALADCPTEDAARAALRLMQVGS